jgi:UDP-hydrolysing UDP-N-acetyl-D-glucosamine 2-epimerase
MAKRKICTVVTNRASYARIKSFLRAAQNHTGLELQLIVGASALLYRFGSAIEVIRKDGFTPNSIVYSIVEGETPATMAKSTGLAIVELATHFENLKPDVVVTVADRFESIATAIAASYMNIPVAHTQGGEVTGSIDENVRHAVTKLSHIHFPATERARDYIIKMGESPETVYLTGCPSLDLLAEIDLCLPHDIFEPYKGVGPSLNPAKPYIVVLQHPVTTEYGQGLAQINETLQAVHRISQRGMQVVWIWPNVDAGSDDISKGLRMFREQQSPKRTHFYRNFSAEDYARLINNAACIVGNSSSGLREGSFLGTPCVNIGSRQQGRERGPNVRDVGYNATDIERAVEEQISRGRYEPSRLYGDGRAGQRIADILARVPLSVFKKLTYTDSLETTIEKKGGLHVR